MIQCRRREEGGHGVTGQRVKGAMGEEGPQVKGYIYYINTHTHMYIYIHEIHTSRYSIPPASLFFSSFLYGATQRQTGVFGEAIYLME